MTTPIAAITIHQPWAQLIALGAKRYETRHWATAYRGLIAIHAGKSIDAIQHIANDLAARRNMDDTRRADFDAKTQRGLFLSHCVTVLRAAGITAPGAVPFGSVIAIARLTACHPTERLHDLSERERLFGDFTANRFAWEMEIVQTFDPIPTRGYQKIWQWTPPADFAVEG